MADDWIRRVDSGVGSKEPHLPMPTVAQPLLKFVAKSFILSFNFYSVFQFLFCLSISILFY